MNVYFYKLDENKNVIPCTSKECDQQLEEMKKNDTKHVAQTTIDNKWISTVWLGLNYRYDDEKDLPPLVFETMILDTKTDEWEDYQKRYSTWEEAELGHERAIQWVKDGCKDNT